MSEIWLRELERFGAHLIEVRAIYYYDADGFPSNLRMEIDTYLFILVGIKDKIIKQTTKFRKPISPEEQLSLTLRFMATGESYKSFSLRFRMDNNTISKIIRQVLQ